MLSSDASITSITVKGETVANLDDGDTNTINLPASQDNTKEKLLSRLPLARALL